MSKLKINAEKEEYLAECKRADCDEICPNCGAKNAYSWDDCHSDIYHIPACSGFEWTCGKCGLSWVEIDSPINAPCYTHSED